MKKKILSSTGRGAFSLIFEREWGAHFFRELSRPCRLPGKRNGGAFLAGNYPGHPVGKSRLPEQAKGKAHFFGDHATFAVPKFPSPPPEKVIAPWRFLGYTIRIYQYVMPRLMAGRITGSAM